MSMKLVKTIIIDPSLYRQISIESRKLRKKSDNFYWEIRLSVFFTKWPSQTTLLRLDMQYWTLSMTYKITWYFAKRLVLVILEKLHANNTVRPTYIRWSQHQLWRSPRIGSRAFSLQAARQWYWVNGERCNFIFVSIYKTSQRRESC